MKKTILLLCVLCIIVSLACTVLAEAAQDNLLINVDECEYKVISFAPLTAEPDEPKEGTTQFELIVEVTKDPQTPITYHPNLVYTDGQTDHEIGVSVRIFDIGAKLSKEFDPLNLYQIEDSSVTKGGKIEYVFDMPAEAEPKQIIFYDKNQTQAVAINANDLPSLSEK